MSPNRTRMIEWSDPMATANGLAGRTGRAFLEAILRGELPRAPIQHTLGFELTEVGDGVAQFRGEFGEHMYNPMGGVHGGVVTTLLDSAMGCAVMSVLDDRSAYTTVDLHVHLTRPITARTGAFLAEGRLVHRGGRVMTAEGKLTDSAGKLLAHATTTCLVLSRE